MYVNLTAIRCIIITKISIPAIKGNFINRTVSFCFVCLFNCFFFLFVCCFFFCNLVLLLLSPTVKVCNKPVDLGFVMDDAGQTADGDDFGVVKQFVMKLDSKFPISDKGTHVGAISFGSQGHLRLLFGDLKGSENTLQHINNLISRWEGKPGDKRIISEGLKLAKDYLYAERNGMRPHAEKVIRLHSVLRSHLAFCSLAVINNFSF